MSVAVTQSAIMPSVSRGIIQMTFCWRASGPSDGSNAVRPWPLMLVRATSIPALNTRCSKDKSTSARFATGNANQLNGF